MVLAWSFGLHRVYLHSISIFYFIIILLIINWFWPLLTFCSPIFTLALYSDLDLFLWLLFTFLSNWLTISSIKWKDIFKFNLKFDFFINWCHYFLIVFTFLIKLWLCDYPFHTLHIFISILIFNKLLYLFNGYLRTYTHITHLISISLNFNLTRDLPFAFECLYTSIYILSCDWALPWSQRLLCFTNFRCLKCLNLSICE